MVKELPLSRKRQELYEALIEAATRTVADQGYQALRARDLANEVGCAVGAIYNVFPDMDALILAVKSRTLDQLQATISERLGPDDTKTPTEAKSRLLAASHIYLDFATRNHRLWLSAFEHSSPETSALQAYMLRLDTIFGNIDRPLRVIVPDMPERQRLLLARAMFSSVHGIVALGLDQKLGDISEADLQWQLDTVLGATLNGLGNHAGTPSMPRNAKR